MPDKCCYMDKICDENCIAYRSEWDSKYNKYGLGGVGQCIRLSIEIDNSNAINRTARNSGY